MLGIYFRAIYYLWLKFMELCIGFKISDLVTQMNDLEKGSPEKAALQPSLSEARAMSIKIQRKILKLEQ